MDATTIKPIVNSGTGAGGAKTNENGKAFEQKTENESRLLEKGFIKHRIPTHKGKNDFYLEKVIDATKKIVYMTQGGLKSYFSYFLQKELLRHPDEAYLYCDGNTSILKILEKKNQNTDGSVDTKLLAANGFVDEYEFCLGSGYKIEYGFCLSEFLKKEVLSDKLKGRCIRNYFAKHNITILFGDDANYYETLDAWLQL